MIDEDPLFSPTGLATYYKVPLATVYKWNSDGTGPRRIHVGRHVRYRKSDCDAWLDSHAADSQPAA